MKRIMNGMIMIAIAALLCACDDGRALMDAPLPFGGKDDPAVFETLRCPEQTALQGKTWAPFGATIDIAGGSGQYVLSAKESEETPFPEWITIDGNTLGAATPVAGQHAFTLVATDAVANAEVECSFELQVLPYIPLPSQVLGRGGISWSAIADIFEENDDPKPSVTYPSLSRFPAIVPELLQSASKITSSQQPKEGKGGASGTTIPPSDPPPTAASVKPPLKVDQLIIKLTTGGPAMHGNQDWSKTECSTSVRFCADSKFLDCTQSVALKPDIASLWIIDQTEANQPDHPLNAIASKITPEHKYFNITLDATKTGPCAINAPYGPNGVWLFRMIDVKMTMSDDTEYRYLNPCVGRWMSPGDTLRFGPNDTAICAVVTTADVEKAGTDNRISLHIDKDSAFTDAVDWQQTSEATTWGPYYEGDNTNSHYPLILGWRDNIPNSSDFYNDFEAGKITSYGFFVFDSDPFANTFDLIMDDNEGLDAWGLKKLTVYRYHPGGLGNQSGEGYALRIEYSQSPLTVVPKEPISFSMNTIFVTNIDNFLALGSYH